MEPWERQRGYNDVKQEWEKRCMYVADIDGCVCLNEHGEFSRAPTRLKGVELVHEWYYEMCANGNFKRRRFIERWLRDDTKRAVLSIVFEPHIQTMAGVYNIFDGFVASKMPITIDTTGADDSPIMNIVYNVFAAGNTDRAEYIMKWFASILKKPMEPTRVALCFCGGDWEYKQVFFSLIINRIIGSQYAGTTADVKNDLLKRFANSHHHAVFVVVNAHHHKSLDKVFTRETYEYRTKGFVEPKTMPNYLNIAIATDEPATPTMRQNPNLVVLDVAPTFDFEIVRRLRTCCSDPLVALAFYRRLMAIDVTHHGA
jgi:hypothetical protein